MIFKFSLVSDEVADFRREIQIDGDDTFFELHKAIMECTGYEDTEVTAFYLCDDWWKRKQEITSIEMDTDSDVDCFVMEDETLSDWLDEEKQKLMFVFDYKGDRGFYMVLSEMILGEYLSKPTCSKKQGTPPSQFLVEEEDEPIKPVVSSIPVVPTPDDDEGDDDEDEIDDDSFYGDTDFNPDELDMDGFEGVDVPDADLDISDEIGL